MSSTPAWTTPTDITQQLNQYWDRGHILSARVTGTPLFPLTLRIKRPDPKALGERFDDVRQWIRALEEGSKSTRGFGYEIVWGETHHRQIGLNRVPTSIHVQTEDDALRVIGKQRQAERFQQIMIATVQAFPELLKWLARRPLRVLESAEEWARILSVLAWFRAHPRCGHYLRQLDIAGVDTKFIETRKGLLSELLDLVLPTHAVNTMHTGARQFESRYGLRDKPTLVRFRILDPQQTVSGLSDLTVDITEFARLSLDIQRVFITENDTNGLAFPQTPGSIVIFGGGYGVNLLAAVPWLAAKALFYWGDLDTHGFSVLSRFRHIFPHTQSLLMDHETLASHRHLWVQEDPDKRCLGTLQGLTEAEQQVYDDIRYDRFGDRVRLEQERIAFRRVEEALR